MKLHHLDQVFFLIFLHGSNVFSDSYLDVTLFRQNYSIIHEQMQNWKVVKLLFVTGIRWLFSLNFQNVELLKQFVSPQTGEVLSYEKTGVCQKQYKNLLIAVRQAWDLGNNSHIAVCCILSVLTGKRIYHWRVKTEVNSWAVYVCVCIHACRHVC